MNPPLVGVVSVELNGEPLRIKGTVTYSLGGKVGEAIEGPTGLAGIARKRMAAFAEIVSIDASDVDLEALQELTAQTVTINLENDKTVVINSATVVGLIEVSTDEGEFTLRLVGPSGKEI